MILKIFSKKKSFLALCVLAMVIAFAGVAWAAYDRFKTDSISDIVLKNGNTDLKADKAVFEARVEPTTVSPNNNSEYKVYIYFSNGLKWGSDPSQIVDTIDFNLKYSLWDGTSSGTPINDNTAKINFLGGFGGNPNIGTFTLPATRQLALTDKSFTAAFTMNDLGANDPYVGIKNGAGSPVWLNTDIVATRFGARTAVVVLNSNSGSRMINGSDYGKLFLNSYYGLDNPQSSPLIPGSLKLNAQGLKNSAAIDVYWHIKPHNTGYVKIDPVDPDSANGLSGSVYDALAADGGQVYHTGNGNYSANEFLKLEFKGTPDTTTTIPEFIITGTMAEQLSGAAPVDRLKDVATFVTLPPILDSKIGVNSYAFDFVKDQPTTHHLTVAYETNAPTAYGIFGAINDANLFDAAGQPLFETDTQVTAPWNGMTVTRSLVQPVAGAPTNYRGISFAFSGAPSTDNHASSLYVGARTTALPGNPTNFSGPFLFGPVAMRITSSAVTPRLTASPNPLTPTVGTAMATTNVIVTSSGGNPVNITGIRQSSTAGAFQTSIPWNGLTISSNTGTSATVTVSGTPTSIAGETFYLYDANSASYATLTINAVSASAPTLQAATSQVTGSVNATLSRTVGITASNGGTVSSLSVSPSSSNGLSFGISGTSVTINGTPTTAGTIPVTVSGTVNGQAANVATFNVVVSGTSGLSLSPTSALTGTVGSRMDTSVTATSATSGSVVVTGLQNQNTSANPSTSLAWNGLTLSVTGSGNVISVSGTPETTGTAYFTVSGTVGGASAASATLRVTVNATGTPVLSLSPTSIATTVGSVMTTRTIDATSTTGGTVALSGVSGPNQSTSTDFYWNGIRIQTGGSRITVSGTPTAAGSATFTAYGSVGGAAATSATFTVTASSTSSTTLFQGTSNWLAHRDDYYHTYDLYIPVTQAFISAFDSNGDGRVETSELRNVLTTMNHPYANLISSYYKMINNDGTAYGSLHLQFDFDPTTGHSADWYYNMILETLEIVGANGTDLSQAFPNGVNLESIQRYYYSSGGGGCNGGAFGLAALALAAFATRRRRRG